MSSLSLKPMAMIPGISPRSTAPSSRPSIRAEVLNSFILLPSPVQTSARRHNAGIGFLETRQLIGQVFHLLTARHEVEHFTRRLLATAEARRDLALDQNDKLVPNRHRVIGV